MFALMGESVVDQRLAHEVEMTLVCDGAGANVSGARCGDHVERRVHCLRRERGPVDDVDRLGGSRDCGTADLQAGRAVRCAVTAL